MTGHIEFHVMTKQLENLASVQDSESNRISVMGFVVRMLVGGFKLPFVLLDLVTATWFSQIYEVDGLVSLSSDKPVLFYIHFSRNDKLTQREMNTLAAAQSAGFQTCLVINSNQPSRKNFELIKDQYMSVSDAQILRRNKGYDLGGYRDSYSLLKKRGTGEFKSVFFMNNSVLWFPPVVKNYLKKTLSLEADIVSSTISSQYQKHIQTFFFGSLTSKGIEELGTWLGTIRNWRSKRTIVRFGEIATGKMFKKDVRIASFPNSEIVQENSLKKIHKSFISKSGDIPYQIIKRLVSNRELAFNGIPTNPSHSNWLELLEAGFPGIKIDLIRTNPTGIPDYEVLISHLLKNGVEISEINKLISSNKPKSLLLRIRIFLKV